MMIVTDLNKQQVLVADPKIIQRLTLLEICFVH